MVGIAFDGPAVAAEPAWVVPGGSAQRGAQRITRFGCAACHRIPGVKNASGNVGPPLDRIADRTYIAGMLRNTPANLVRWIREPQAVVPGNAMPNMGVSEADARDIAAYLYTLR
jgi:cytochrome c2